MTKADKIDEIVAQTRSRVSCIADAYMADSLSMLIKKFPQYAECFQDTNVAVSITNCVSALAEQIAETSLRTYMK